jgi:putative transposase
MFTETDSMLRRKRKAERALYESLRDVPDLIATLVQKGIRGAVEAVTSGVGRHKRGEKTT